jgi:predicted O-methyltransferase YrrM
MKNLSQTRDLLRQSHTHYTNTISSSGMALSLETAALIWTLCDDRLPRTIVDLGSGYSSFIIRNWMKISGHQSIIWSVDDDVTWLQKSLQYCEKQNVDTSNFTTWDLFKPTLLKFDMVIYDLGRMPVRFENVRSALDLCSPYGIVVIDDMHKFNYHNEVKCALAEKGFTGVDMKELTTDAHEGRHCWLATR